MTDASLTARAAAAPREQLRQWLVRKDHALAEAAIALAASDDVRTAVTNSRDGVSASQLRALLNTTRACKVKDVVEFAGRRGQRRRKAKKELEAAFWEAVVHALKSLPETFSNAAAQDCDLDEEPAGSDGVVTGARLARQLVTRAYIEHFVAHCQYVQGKHL